MYKAWNGGSYVHKCINFDQKNIENLYSLVVGNSDCVFALKIMQGFCLRENVGTAKFLVEFSAFASDCVVCVSVAERTSGD